MRRGVRQGPRAGRITETAATHTFVGLDGRAQLSRRVGKRRD